MTSNAGRIPTSKWTKHNILRKDERLAPHLPDTNPYTPAIAAAYLQDFGCIIIKPEWSEGGHRVCRICRNPNGYAVDHGDVRTHVDHFRQIEQALPTWIARKPCLVQRYIRLARLHGRPVDIRTIIQRRPDGRFEVSGTFCKIAPAARFVTNVKQGGVALPLRRYLSEIAPEKSAREQVLRELYRISEHIGQTLGGQFRNHVYGIDLGLDEQRKIWIIEVNTQPNLDILLKIDPGMHRRAKRLQRYHRAQLRNRRTYPAARRSD